MADLIEFMKEQDISSGKNRVDLFAKISNYIFSNVCIRAGDKKFRIYEIEFYSRTNEHKDEYTHKNPLQKKFGKWYFHQTKKGNYKGGTFKGLDMTFGEDNEDEDKNIYFGILIRSIFNESDKKFITGPCNSVNALLKEFKCSNVKEYMKNREKDQDLVSENEKNLHIIIEKRDISEIYKGPRIGLSDKYLEWRDIHYRFSQTNKIKKKRSLEIVEI